MRNKINALEVKDLREAGWTLQRLADRYACSRGAVSLYLSRSRTRVNQPAGERPCAKCGVPVIVVGDKRKRINVFCSTTCYHAWYPTGNFIQSRHGKRLARLMVAKVFPLLPEHVVHHVDGNQTHNTLDNFWVFASQKEHMSFHRGGSGQPIWRGDAH